MDIDTKLYKALKSSPNGLSSQEIIDMFDITQESVHSKLKILKDVELINKRYIILDYKDMSKKRLIELLKLHDEHGHKLVSSPDARVSSPDARVSSPAYDIETALTRKATGSGGDKYEGLFNSRNIDFYIPQSKRTDGEPSLSLTISFSHINNDGIPCKLKNKAKTTGSDYYEGDDLKIYIPKEISRKDDVPANLIYVCIQ